MRPLVVAGLLVVSSVVACGGGDDGGATGGAVAGSGGAMAGSATAGAGAAGSGMAGSGNAGSGTAGSLAAGASGTGGSSGAAGQSGSSPTCKACDASGATPEAVAVPYPALVELSGLAASRAHPGVLWGHNDSGDAPRFFAFGLDGAAKGELRLAGAQATDWEDVAVGPCGSKTCVFLGDVGDNAEARTEYSVYVVEEPALPVDPKTPVDVPFSRVRFTYPDGSHNAETLMAHPATGDVYVVTKVGTGKSGVYRLAAPLDLTNPMVATKVADLQLPASGSPLATGGDIHPCGDRFLLRVYGGLYEFRAPAGGDLAAAFAATPVKVTSPTASVEPQGEAVAYLPEGKGWITGSEDPAQKAPVALHAYACP